MVSNMTHNCDLRTGAWNLQASSFVLSERKLACIISDETEGEMCIMEKKTKTPPYLSHFLASHGGRERTIFNETGDVSRRQLPGSLRQMNAGTLMIIMMTTNT